MIFSDWLPIAGTDPDDDSGIASSIRTNGIYKTIMDRAKLTASILGKGSRLGIWLPLGIRRDLFDDKATFRFYYPNAIDNWENDLMRGARYAQIEHGVQLVPYLGKISLANPTEFDQMLRILLGMGSTEVILDVLSDPNDRVSPVRVYELRKQRITHIVSEFPEMVPTLADSGLAIDQAPKPNGSPQGAELAVKNGNIPNGMPVKIVITGQPDVAAERIKRWQAEDTVDEIFGRLRNPQIRAAIEAAMGGG